jgi:hypothetical protein
VKRRPLPVPAALAATAALLLTACGSGDADSKANDKIAGAGGTDDTASPNATASDSAQRPKITLPSDVTNVFEGWKTGDVMKDAVLTDASRRIDALVYAITQGNTDEPVLGDGSIGEPYAKGKAELDPPCSVQYLRSSGDGAFDLRATVTWQITWTGTGGAGGKLPDGTFGADQAVTVQEIQAVNR